MALAAQTVALFRIAFVTHQEMFGTLAKALQLQTQILLTLNARIDVARPVVLPFEFLDDRLPTRLGLDAHEAPRLAQSYRRREMGRLQHVLQQGFGHGILPETPHVAPGGQQFVKPVNKCRIKLHPRASTSKQPDLASTKTTRYIGGVYGLITLIMLTSTPLTPPDREPEQVLSTQVVANIGATVRALDVRAAAGVTAAEKDRLQTALLETGLFVLSSGQEADARLDLTRGGATMHLAVRRPNGTVWTELSVPWPAAGDPPPNARSISDRNERIRMYEQREMKLRWVNDPVPVASWYPGFYGPWGYSFRGLHPAYRGWRPLYLGTPYGLDPFWGYPVGGLGYWHPNLWLGPPTPWLALERQQQRRQRRPKRWELTQGDARIDELAFAEITGDAELARRIENAQSSKRRWWAVGFGAVSAGLVGSGAYLHLGADGTSRERSNQKTIGTSLLALGVASAVLAALAPWVESGPVLSADEAEARAERYNATLRREFDLTRDDLPESPASPPPTDVEPDRSKPNREPEAKPPPS